MADTEWMDSPGHRSSHRRNGAGGGGGGAGGGGGETSTPTRQPSSRGASSLAQPQPGQTADSNSPSASSSLPMRQLEFTQAMNDFHHMFPSMDREVIEAVLRANNGIVDATIDQLLTMSIDNDDNDLPDHILMSVQRDVALESLNDNSPRAPPLGHKPSSSRLSKQEEQSLEESPPSYTEAIKSPHVMTTASGHRHHTHHHHRRSSPTNAQSQRRASPRHHPHHHHPSPPTSRANILDLASDDVIDAGTETKHPPSSWESATMGLPRHAAGFFESPSRRIGWNDVNTYQSKRSAMKTASSSSRHRSSHDQEDLSFPQHRSSHHSSRKVSWDTAPMRSKSFGGADTKRNSSASPSHHRSGSGKKLPPYRNWNPPLLGTLPDDFLRLKPKVPERVPLMTQKSDPGTRRHNSTSLFDTPSFHRSLSGKEESVNSSSSHWKSQSHHVPFRSMSFAGSSPSRSGMPQRLVTQDISSDFIQRRMRENERRRKQASVDLDPELSQYLEDERLALILQNSEFLQELRDDETFMKTLERDRQTAADEYASAQELRQQQTILGAAAAVETEAVSNDSPAGIDPEDQEGYGDDRSYTLEAFPFSQQLPKASKEDAEFLQKLRYMGKASKKQFASLARRFFSRKRKKSPRHLLRDSLAPSMTNLLDEEEVEEEEEEGEVLGSSPIVSASAQTQTYGSGRSGFRVDGLPPNNSTTDFV